MKRTIKDLFKQIYIGLSVGSISFLAFFLIVYSDIISNDNMDPVFRYILNLIFWGAVIIVTCTTGFYLLTYIINKKYRLKPWLWSVSGAILGFLIYFLFLIATDIAFNIESFVLASTTIIIAEVVVFLVQRYYKSLAKKINEKIKAKNL